MSEEYGNDFVTLIDEDGNEVEFEHIDTVEYEGVTYLAFIPAELSVEEDAEVVIMQVVTDENGEELLNYWFSGFYPADDPRYTITVLQDGILKPETSSAAIFAKVTEILAVWENS